MARNEYFRFKTVRALTDRIDELGLAPDIGLCEDVGPSSDRFLSSSHRCDSFDLSNRFVAQPMEGWDGDPVTGSPTEDVLRRWERIGSSGAALAWGLEAIAVGFEFRANPRQLVLTGENAGAFAAGLGRMRAAAGRGGIVVGAQLTCSGRYSFGAPEQSRPRLVYHHPELDRRIGADDSTSLATDGELEEIVGYYAKAARTAREAGFDFIDVKACHRYWMNETLAARTRPGRYGGRFENRVRILEMTIDAIRREVGAAFPLGVRLSAYDGIPFEEDPGTRRKGLKGYGRPSEYRTPYLWGFGVDETDPQSPDMSEPIRLTGLLKARGVRMINVSAGSPYASPHILRPTESPPVDGYQPAEDPLHAVALHFRLARGIKEAHPDVTVVGSGYSYLRQFKAHAAEYNLSRGRVDLVGFGRALLSYHDEIRQILETGEARPGRGRVVCTGDSACTTGPRLGLPSGCVYDPYYGENNRMIRRRLADLGITRK